MAAEIDDKMSSNSHYMLWASTCAIAASVVLLASCSVFQPVIDVVPVGSLQQGVVFYLGDIFRPHPEFTITGGDGARGAIRWLKTCGMDT